MINRRTSIYTLHVTFDTRDAATAFLDRQVTGVHDRYYAPENGRYVARLSWRATDDHAATAAATEALNGVEASAELTTGLAVHRRTVAAQP